MIGTRRLRRKAEAPPFSPGFTLIELMIAVAIVGLLAAIAVPKFAELIRKSNEGATKGNLAALRSALKIYYADMEGHYPDDPVALTSGGKYMAVLPAASMPPYHGPTGVFSRDSGTAAIDDAGGWAYDNGTSDANFGKVWVNCTHTDAKGSSWSVY